MKRIGLLMMIVAMGIAAHAQNVDGGANDLMKKVAM